MHFGVTRLPRWSIILSGYLLVALIGYLDFLTGDYSLLIFYTIPISLMAWHLGRWHAALLAAAAGGARFASDCYSYSASTVRYWNSLQDMGFLLLVGFLVSTVRALLTDEGRRRG